MSGESETHVRDLCQKVVEMKQESPEFSSVVRDLTLAIGEHVASLRDKVADLALVIANESGSKATD